MSSDRRLVGFQRLSPEERSAIARAGGRASQARGVGHRFTSEEARIAGRKGGAKVAADRAHMGAIGKKGGAAWGKKRRGELDGDELVRGNVVGDGDDDDDEAVAC